MHGRFPWRRRGRSRACARAQAFFVCFRNSSTRPPRRIGNSRQQPQLPAGRDVTCDMLDHQRLPIAPRLPRAERAALRARQHRCDQCLKRDRIELDLGLPGAPGCRVNWRLLTSCSVLERIGLGARGNDHGYGRETSQRQSHHCFVDGCRRRYRAYGHPLAYRPSVPRLARKNEPVAFSIAGCAYPRLEPWGRATRSCKSSASLRACALSISIACMSSSLSAPFFLLMASLVVSS